jgi:hypothetical protein
MHTEALSFDPEAIQRSEDAKSWANQGFAWVMPLSDGMVPFCAVSTWMSNVHPSMNQATTGLITSEHMEVGDAYNHLFKIATDREYARKKYTDHAGFLNLIDSTHFVLTTEHDNIIPPNAVQDLMVSIYTCPDCEEELSDVATNPDWLCPNGHRGLDAVSGLYMTKCDPPMPMAYGNPKNGPDDFRPQSIKKAVENRKTIEVNGIGMGCAIWRKELFKHVSEPWFLTQEGGTQDLYFARKAKEEAGARFGVHCGVRVGHYDIRTRRMY